MAIPSGVNVGSGDLGTLAIVVLKARNLPDKHTFSKQDPFATIELGASKEKTKVDNRGGQHPVWDDEFRVKIPKDGKKPNRTLKITCYAKEPKEDELIGSADLDVSETLQKLEFDDWIKLEKDGAYRGEIYLEMTFFPSGPRARPIDRRPSKLHPNERLWRPSPGQTPPRTSPQPVPNDLPAAGKPQTPPRNAYLTPPLESRTPSPQTQEALLPPIPGDYPADQHPGAQPRETTASHARLSASQERDEGKAARVPTILRPGGPGAKGRKRQDNGGGAEAGASQPLTNSGASYSSPYDPQLPSRSTEGSSPGQSVSSPYQSQTNVNQPAYGHQPRPQSPYEPQQQAFYQQEYPPQNQPTRRESAPGIAFPEPAIQVQGPSPTSPPPMQQHSYSYPEQTPILPGGPTVYDNRQPTFSYPQGFTPSPSPRPGAGYQPHPQQERRDPERNARLAARYGSPMPLPPGSSRTNNNSNSSPSSNSQPLVRPKPTEPPQPQSQSPPRSHHDAPARSRSNSPPPPSYSHEDKGKARAPAPSRTPEPTAYLERERRALERARQEEEDAELARRLAAEEEAPLPSQNAASAAGKGAERHSNAGAGAGAGRRKGKETERVETDEEFAKRLARELNEDVVSEVRKGASATAHMPGAYNT